MGRCESSCVSLGLRIPLQKLLACVTEANFSNILQMLTADEGFIEDENDNWNESYDLFREQLSNATHKTKEALCNNTAETFVTRITTMLQNHGNVHYLRDGSRIHTPEEGTLLAQTLLLPTVPVVENGRWGYNREGVNGASIPITNFDYAAHVESIRQKYLFLGADGGEIVFMVCQKGF